MAGCCLGALYCWFWVTTISLAYGPRFNFWQQLGGLGVSLVALVCVAYWMARQMAPLDHSAIRFWIILAAWSLGGAGLWIAMASPFSRHAALLVGFAATTWWILWAWLMFFVRWRPWTRAGVMAGLLFVASAFFVTVRADGLDGDALPRFAWRFATTRPDWPATASTLSPADSSESNTPETTAAEPRDDYPRFRGADGLGTVTGVNLERDWSKHPPRLRWRQTVGAAWSSFAVAGLQVFTQEQRGAEECVTCYDRATGRQLWVHADAAHYENASTGDGPRATPTVDGGQVFTLGATGILNALDVATGQRLWKVDILKDSGATAPAHGMVSSPLVVEDAVIVCAGGSGTSLVAYDRTTGIRLWGAGSDPAGYTSPLLVELGGQRQIIAITPDHIHGHDAATGRVLWTADLHNEQQTNCSQPYPVGANRLFASTNYGTGCTLLEIKQEGSAWNAQPLWAKRTLQTKFCSPIVYDGHASGLDDGILECVSLEDGRRKWKRGRFGHGQMLLAGDLLLIQAEDGRVGLAEAQPDKFVELGSIPALEGRTWNYPALAGNQLFIRNDREAACYELPRAGN